MSWQGGSGCDLGGGSSALQWVVHVPPTTLAQPTLAGHR